jgi:hypothetical protein
MLPPENPWFNGTPAGSPNGFRVSAGVTISTLGFNQFQNLFDKASSAQRIATDVSLVGPSASVGLQGRWFMAVIDARYVTGSTSGTAQSTDTTGPRPTTTESPVGVHGTLPGALARGGFWAAIEAQPLCDFSLGLGFSLSAVTSGGPRVNPTTEAAWTIHVGYEPNRLRRRRPSRRPRPPHPDRDYTSSRKSATGAKIRSCAPVHKKRSA